MSSCQTFRPRKALTSICMEVTLKCCLLGLSRSPCFGRSCLHVAVALANRKYKNLNSIKLQLHFHHATYYSCSYVVNSIHENFMETNLHLHLQISQHQVSLKHENFILSYHSYPTPHYYRKAFCSYSYILVVHFTASTIWGLQKLGLVGMVSCLYIRGVQPFAIAGRVTFINMKYGRQWFRVIFMRYVWWNIRLLPSANQHRAHSSINCVFIL